MRKCEMDGAPTEANWAPFYGFGHEHGVLCQRCALDIAAGKMAKANKAPKDPSQFDSPIYPPDELPKDLARITAEFVGVPVTQGIGGEVIGKE